MLEVLCVVVVMEVKDVKSEEQEQEGASEVLLNFLNLYPSGLTQTHTDTH